MGFFNKLLVVFFLFGLILTSNKVCFGVDVVEYKNINDVPSEVWESLSRKKIYFGHQSVGFNIMDGIKELMRQYPIINLNIIESDDVAKEGGVFAHSRIGKNREPEGKIREFFKIVDRNGEYLPDLAFLKFCYVDMHDRIDVNNLFAQYKEAVKVLRDKHPNIFLIHFTMPLRSQEFTWKTRLKIVLAREPWELKDAVKRNQFNSMMLKEYQGREPIFDIARFEATAPDASVSSFYFKGSDYLALQPQYTYDGGHLNQLGRTQIAEKFLLFLVNNLSEF